MKVILKSDVPNLGRAGDIKEVKNGYARNFLLPRNLVMRANARTEKELDFLKKVQERKIQKRKKTAEETAKALNGQEVAVTMNVIDGKMFGSVTNILISKALAEKDFSIDKKHILLEEPIKTLGIFKVKVKFYDDISSEITVKVQDQEGKTEIPVTVVDPAEESKKIEQEAVEAARADEATEEETAAEAPAEGEEAATEKTEE